MYEDWDDCKGIEYRDFDEEIDYGAVFVIPRAEIEYDPCAKCSNRGKVCHCTLGLPKITY